MLANRTLLYIASETFSYHRDNQHICFMHLPNTFAISFFSLGFSEKKLPNYITRQPPPPIVVSKSLQFVPKTTICRFLAERG